MLQIIYICHHLHLSSFCTILMACDNPKTHCGQLQWNGIFSKAGIVHIFASFYTEINQSQKKTIGNCSLTSLEFLILLLCWDKRNSSFALWPSRCSLWAKRWYNSLQLLIWLNKPLNATHNNYLNAFSFGFLNMFLNIMAAQRLCITIK